jgi:hypothetical protein
VGFIPTKKYTINKLGSTPFLLAVGFIPTKKYTINKLNVIQGTQNSE